MPNGGKNWNELGWAEWKGEVGKTIEILEEGQRDQWDILRDVRDDVIRLKMKMALIGASGGGVAGALTAGIIEIIKRI